MGGFGPAGNLGTFPGTSGGSGYNTDFSAPGSTPLTIGTVTFWTMECPADLPIGAVEQRVAVTELIGGGRVVQNLGVQPKRVQWRGKLFQPNVESRITALRQMAVLGAPVSITWGYEQYTCVIVAFTPTYHNINYADYEIEIEITQSNNGVLTGNPPTAPDQQVNQQSNEAGGSGNNLNNLDPTGSQIFYPDLESFLQALQGAGPLSQLTQAQILTLLNGCNGVIALVQQYLGNQSPTSQEYALAQQLINTLTLLAANLSNGETQQTIVVQGGTLYHIASKYCGDPTQAGVIQVANGLPSPILPTGVATTLVIPAGLGQAA